MIEDKTFVLTKGPSLLGVNLDWQWNISNFGLLARLCLPS